MLPKLKHWIIKSVSVILLIISAKFLAGQTSYELPSDLVSEMELRLAKSGIFIDCKDCGPQHIYQLSKRLLESNELDCFREKQARRTIQWKELGAIIYLESREWMIDNNGKNLLCDILLPDKPLSLIGNISESIEIVIDKYALGGK